MARTRAAVLVVLAAAVLLGASRMLFPRRGDTTWTVTEVVDGDTVAVTHGGRTDIVRLLGVDTPETKHPDRPVGCFGPEAAAYTASRLAGRDVQLETDVETRDRYDRLLAYVTINGEHFNETLLREGFATLLVIPPNDRHGRSLLRAELDARSARRGLWAACPSTP